MNRHRYGGNPQRGRVHGGRAGLVIETAARRAADARITLDLAALVGLLSDPGPGARRQSAAVDGDRLVASKAIESLAGALPPGSVRPGPG